MHAQGTCRRCGLAKPQDRFARDASKPSGYKTLCKDCDNARCRSYYTRVGGARKAAAYNASRRKPDHPCPGCGAAIPARRKRCESCQAKHRANRTYERTCRICLETFTAHDRTTMTCPDHRRMRTFRLTIIRRKPPAVRQPNLDRTCRGCGASFTATHGSQRYCAQECRFPPAATTWYAGDCQECDAPYVVRTYAGSTIPRFCSDACQRRARRRRDKAARSKRIHAGVKREQIGHVTIAKRDGWKCHICGKKVTRSNWSIDHLIPLSDGGTHTRDNVALAHFICNTRRGATGPAQLMLVG